MQVNSATSADRSSSAATDATATTRITNKGTLNSNDFMKLLSVQFQNQDPMKPVDDTAFMAQMAQFTALEQSNSLVQQMTALASSQSVVTASSYLGRQVTLDDGKGSTVTGLVSGVDLSSGTPRLMVGDYSYPLSSVLYVEPAALSTQADFPPAA